jgi:hypothetical protein
MSLVRQLFWVGSGFAGAYLVLAMIGWMFL